MNFDYVKHRKKYFTLSIGILLFGILSLLFFQLNLGIDFKSGTRLEIQATKTIQEKELKNTLKNLNLESKEITFSGNENEIGVVRFPEALSKEQIAKLKNVVKEEYKAEASISTVSPTIGKELVKNAVISIAIASIGIVIYVAIRFDWLMGLATVIAMLHDVFFVIAIFSIFKIEIDLTFVAAILTITGYSINDTIVNFDRIRDNLRETKKVETFEDLARIVNLSLNQTLARTINTVITVVIAATALLIFGSESIRTFSLALVLGLISGTYSSLYIASQLWIIWKLKELQKPKKEIKELDKELEV